MIDLYISEVYSEEIQTELSFNFLKIKHFKYIQNI